MQIPWSRPLSVEFEVTHNCNLDCVYCYAFPRISNESTTEQIFNIIDAIFDKINPLEFVLLGGEPFIRTDIDKIILYALEHIDLIGISSNGTLIHRYINFLREYREHIGLQISIDSIYPSINDKLRGLTEVTIRNIKLLLDNGIQPTIAITITRLNIESIPDSIKKLSEMGIKHFHLMNLMPSVKVVKQRMYRSLLPGDTQITSLIQKLAKMIRSGELPKDIHIDLPSSSMFSLFSNSYHNDNVAIEREPVHIPGCLAGISRITVTPSGDILPCSMVRVPIGNILRESWDHIRRKKKYKEIIESDTPLCFKYNLHFS